jgi:hypothetical protein
MGVSVIIIGVTQLPVAYTCCKSCHKRTSPPQGISSTLSTTVAVQDTFD